MLLGCCKFLWQKDCNGTRCVLKRSVIASRRIQNFEKRLINFGDTTSNVQIFIRELKVVILGEILSFLLKSQ
mgnify:CR=1 FL=1